MDYNNGHEVIDENVDSFKSINMNIPAENSIAAFDKIISITEAARRNNVTRQAIYVAIKQKKLKATKKDSRWMIHVDDLVNYTDNKYSRTKSVYNGELVFDNDKGYYSINQVADMLGVPAQKIYYATRVGLLKGARKKAAWVIHIDEVNSYKATYLERKKSLQVS